MIGKTAAEAAGTKRKAPESAGSGKIGKEIAMVITAADLSRECCCDLPTGICGCKNARALPQSLADPGVLFRCPLVQP